MKSLCIVDTCSLIYLANTDAQIANKKPFNWLLDEFDIKYSRTVLNEINRHKGEIPIKRTYENYVWDYAEAHLENKLFNRELTRIVQEPQKCPRCGQTIFKRQKFTPDLDEDTDRGERQNCCVSIDAIQKKNYSQVIFLTDDLRAVRDYASYIFNTFPLGVIWSSLDFIVFLFMKYKNRIELEQAKDCLRSVNALNGLMPAPSSAARLSSYLEKLEQINEMLS